MAYRTSRKALNRDDYSVLMLAFGFGDVDQFIEFIGEQQLKAWALDNQLTGAKISYPAKSVVPQRRYDRPMVYGSGRV